MIYFFVSGDKILASSRTRAYMICDRLAKYKERGEVHRVVMRPFWNFSSPRLKEFFRNFKIFFNSKKEDVFILQKTISQLDFILIVLFFKIFFNKKIYFDFDDAIFLYSKKMKIKTIILCKISNG
ncbi:hypothetical protein EOM09_08790, partial [bacterium]|nr:hypothetical protein [bacterium]